MKSEKQKAEDVIWRVRGTIEQLAVIPRTAAEEAEEGNHPISHLALQSFPDSTQLLADKVLSRSVGAWPPPAPGSNQEDELRQFSEDLVKLFEQLVLLIGPPEDD